MEALLGFLIFGVTIGVVYGIVALGISLIYTGLDIVHFAHGEIYMFGAFFGLVFAHQYNVPYWLAILCGRVDADLAVTGGVHTAIDAIKANRFDLVLMDLHMPEIDGFQTTAAIRKLDGQRSEVPIVALTANLLHARRRSYLEADMDACITKPVDARQLFKTISHFIEHGRDSRTASAHVRPPPGDAAYYSDRREFA